MKLRPLLSSDEAAELRKLEQQVYENLADNNYLLCLALLTIHRRELYRPETIQAYFFERFNLSRPHTYSRMNAGKTYEALMEGQKFDVKDLPSLAAAEAISLRVDKLIKEANIDGGTEQGAIKRQLIRIAYDVIVLSSRKDRKGETRIPPAAIESAFAGLMEVARTF